MTYKLSPEQTQLWNEGGWLAFEIEETVLEDVERLNIQAPWALHGDQFPLATTGGRCAATARAARRRTAAGARCGVLSKSVTPGGGCVSQSVTPASARRVHKPCKY